MHKFTYSTVFIVDDNSTANLVHQHLLKRISIADDIQTFTNPINALKDLRKELIGDEKRILVLLDIHMPEMNGFEFLKACSLFSDNYETLDIIMVTSSIDERELQQVSEHPSVRKVITKPLKGNQILDFVTQKSLISA